MYVSATAKEENTIGGLTQQMRQENSLAQSIKKRQIRVCYEAESTTKLLRVPSDLLIRRGYTDWGLQKARENAILIVGLSEPLPQLDD